MASTEWIILLLWPLANHHCLLSTMRVVAVVLQSNCGIGHYFCVYLMFKKELCCLTWQGWSICPCLTFTSQKTCLLNKGYQIQSSVPSGWLHPISPEAETPNGKKYYILFFLCKNKHTYHWLQLIESWSSIMWNHKAWPADYGDSDACIHAGTVTKRGAAIACGQGWLALPVVLTN